MCAEGAHFDTRSVRSVLSDAYVAAENILYFFFRCGEKALRGFVCNLNLPRDENSAADSFSIVCNKFGDHDPNGMLYVRRICCTRMKSGFKILRGCPDFGETCGRGER